MQLKHHLNVSVALLFLAAGAAESGLRLEDGPLTAAFDAHGEVTVTDSRCGRVWTSRADARTATVVDVRRGGKMIRCRVSAGDFTADGAWTFDRGELVFSLVAPTGSVMTAAICYPAAFVAAKGERILLPHGCGYAFDAGETDLGGFKAMEEMAFYTRNMKMGCWGHYAEHVGADGAYAQDAGYLAIVETPHDAKLDFRVRGNGCRAASVAWQPEKRSWGYDRTIRYAFFDKASPVTMAARYRSEMKRRGYLVTWREKARRHPEMAARYELLKGAPDVWYWEVDGAKGRLAAELRTMGFTNFLFSTVTRRDLNVWVTPEEVREIVKTPGVIATEYDIYRDTMEPAMLDKIDAVRPHWPLAAWDRGDCVMCENGSMARGWKVALKTAPDVPKVGCALLCEAQAIPYVRERVSKRLTEAPYGARFLDVTGTSIGTCFHPRHPLTRRASERARQATFRMLADEFALLCGAEDGLECFVPCCDYFEGNFSAAYYRVDGGRYMWRTYEKSPEIMRRAIDPATRVPFFEMVFHDCIASYWYWTDYNNRFEDTWWQRDLLNAVSGTPPMYFFTREVFERQKARLAASVKIAARTAKVTADATIVGWRWLTADRLVQESRFSNGYAVLANFSENPYRATDGSVIPPREAKVTEP